jgi:hypothetical protein
MQVSIIKDCMNPVDKKLCHTIPYHGKMGFQSGRESGHKPHARWVVTVMEHVMTVMALLVMGQ